jgi:hypothetical protein
MEDILNRNDKVDPADAKDSSETFLPGQIPVDDVVEREISDAEERQPNPLEAEKAVNDIQEDR